MLNDKTPEAVGKDFCAVIFDLDGTLVDSLQGIAMSMNLALERQGFDTIPIEEYRYLVGDGVEEMVRRAMTERVGPDWEQRMGEDGLKEFVADFRREYDRLWPVASPPYPGIQGLLDGLGRRGVFKAVLSNKVHDYTEVIVRTIFPEGSFDLVRGALPGVPFKPDPAPALAIASETGIPPASFVFLGDTAIDIRTAKSAGMFPAGALWGFRGRGELAEAGAAVLAAEPGDLLTLPFHPRR